MFLLIASPLLVLAYFAGMFIGNRRIEKKLKVEYDIGYERGRVHGAGGYDGPIRLCECAPLGGNLEFDDEPLP